MSIQEKAFPNPHLRGDMGMDLRDYFAAMAMPIVLKRLTEDAIRDKQPSLLESLDGDSTDLAIYVAEECYAMADAMMEARK